MKSNTGLHRRDFLRLLLRGLVYIISGLGLWQLLRYLGWQAPPSMVGEVTLKDGAGMLPGERRTLSDPGVVFIHDAQGWRALSLTCPHLGCRLKEEADGYHCPCHGSAFDRDGRRVKGPAGGPMRALKVRVEANGDVVALIE